MDDRIHLLVVYVFVSASYPFNPKSFAAKLLAAADQYDLESLKKKCQSLILEKVSRESVSNLLRLVENCHCAELKSACLKFAVVKGCEENWPLLFLDLCGSKDDLSTNDNPSMSGGGGVLGLCHRVFFTLKESIWCAASPHRKQKVKSV